MSTVWNAIRRHLAAFRAGRGGNVAVMFALVTVPIIAMVGFSVDYTRANAVKTAMQNALDSTALMLSKNAGTLSEDDLQTQANSYFKALFNLSQATNVNVSASYSTSGGATLTVNGSADVPTTFLAVLGYKDLAVDGSSTTKWGSSRLRVSLVLDNTGSMADSGKLDALKTATSNLLTQLKNAVSTSGDVYVSIIPFVKDVSVDATGYSSSWDSWIQWDDGTDNSWDGSNGSCSMGNKSKRSSCTAQSYCSLSGYSSQSSCTSAGTCSLSSYTSQSSCTGGGTCSLSGHSTQSSCTSAGVCSLSGYSTQSSCTSAGKCSNTSYTTQTKCTSKGYVWTTGVWTKGVWTAGVWTPGVWTQATWTPNNHSTWNGCFMDRGTSSAPGTSAGYDQDVTAPTSSIAATLFPAEQYSSCPKAAMMGLNEDWTTMNALVTSMTANGNTNQPIGLVWGWLSLAGGGPFSVPSFDANYSYQQIIILLSDGMNTQDRWYSDQTSIDNRMWDKTTGNGTCANIKAAGITIYSIQVNTGKDPTSTLLQKCASNTSGTTDHFFLLTSADQIVTTFQTIGTSLTKLRVAK
jgi:Flp pilus assembly protein TadG